MTLDTRSCVPLVLHSYFLLWVDGNLKGVLQRWDSIVHIDHLHNVHCCIVRVLAGGRG